MDAREDHLQCLADDPNLHILPSDYELVVSDVSETAAVLRMYSRSAGAAYDWREERGVCVCVRGDFFFLKTEVISCVVFPGLAMKSKEHFWSYVAEYPSHHSQLPFNTETEFIEAIRKGERDICLSPATTAEVFFLFLLPLEMEKNEKKAKVDIQSGVVFAFSEHQIDQIIARYQYLTGVYLFFFNYNYSLWFCFPGYI